MRHKISDVGINLIILVICGRVSKICCCLKGDNPNLGAIVESYTLNSQAVFDRSESEMTNMVNILSTRFTRVSLYASDDQDSADSQIFLVIAKANSKNSNQRNLTVFAAIQDLDINSYEEALDYVFSGISESNIIHPGTVRGLIVASFYYEELQNFQYQDMLKSIKGKDVLKSLIPADILNWFEPQAPKPTMEVETTGFWKSIVPNIKNVFETLARKPRHASQSIDSLKPTINVDLLSKLFPALKRPMEGFQTIPKLFEIARNHPERGELPIGIRSGNCEQIQKLCLEKPIIPHIRTVQESLNEVVEDLSFLICREFPSPSSAPKQSAKLFIAKMNGLLEFINRKWPSLDVIIETGWPTDGNTINGIEGSITSMNAFWCEINQWSKQNSIKVDFFTAFDTKNEKVSSLDPVTNYGWWTRISNEQSRFIKFVEKNVYTATVKLQADLSSERREGIEAQNRSFVQSPEDVKGPVVNSSGNSPVVEIQPKSSPEIPADVEIQAGNSSVKNDLQEIGRSFSGDIICINGENILMGAVVEPYIRKTKNGSDVSESEISAIVNMLSKKFARISLYGSDDPSSIDSKILLEVAKFNTKNPRERQIRINAALQPDEENAYKQCLKNILIKIENSNRISPGTVTGLIVASSYIKELQDFEYEDNSESDIGAQIVLLLPKLLKPQQEIQAMWNRIETAKSHPNIRGIPIGIRSGNCADIESKILSIPDGNTMIDLVKSYIGKFFEGLDFLICRQFPTSSSTPKESAAALIAKMDKILVFFKNRWPNVNVIMETGWPTGGGAINGIRESVSAMNTFWCEIDEWSRNNSIQVDFYSAFDGTQNCSMQPETNYGWWSRILDKHSGISEYVEKIKYNSSDSHEVMFPAVHCEEGAMDHKLQAAVSSTGSFTIMPTVAKIVSLTFMSFVSSYALLVEF